ncbi:Na+/H+ antiporter NhaA type [Arcticibacter svalbardensis MN12-7]|uniref:Na(+)/H(+) antiporter NhaA n=1 Tax=Arcticibacter svalbardensis MN12-7 TaxID=1150600 RepID=R9GWH2_9SPHI|nr:Na+/H+ antiporter NhaA [Arcticibacter svalbardensis]EOR93289.1 Na+/H+ antiporter NhaA type [Arcticibacter svalbardensis MN12-7]
MLNQKTPIEKLIAPVNRFIHLEYTSGIVLLASVVIAIIWANSAYNDLYHHIWDITFSIGVNELILKHSLHIWINDGLMAIFFFVIGLELKREFMNGELSTLRKAILPMSAALGGMILPAVIYYAINIHSGAAHGWGIPMATDIAFALALLSMAGKNIPASVKVFLSALAVADDLGAVLVIAFFYTVQVNFVALAVAGIFLLVLICGNFLGVRNTMFYVIIGIGVWIGFLLSGVHATIAGVLVAFTIPAVTRINETVYSDNLKKLTHQFEKEIPSNSTLTTPSQHETIQHVKTLSLAAETPLQKIEYALHPWVAFFIMPIFALANSGIVIGADFLSSVINPVSIGVAAGLVVGKFIGILLFTCVMVKFGLGSLPQGANWKHMTGVALLGGVGFTMSLFISGLAFSKPEFVDQAKYGILIASILAGLAGSLVLRKIR